jgi:hypothetical protein
VPLPSPIPLRPAGRKMTFVISACYL